ncbi:MAG: hypothetical protein MZU97_19320 [Bacillus subtilis]|nr:hypothetical protein [Bacillus subtilis]
MRRADGSVDEYKVSEDLIVEFRLIEGQTLDDFAFVSFQNAVKIDGVMQKSVASNRAPAKDQRRIRNESSQASGLSAAEQATLLGKLERLRLIDDAAFARRFVRLSNRCPAQRTEETRI